MGWMVPATALGMDQVSVLNSTLNSSNRITWIKGFAGSGKTVLLMHLMLRLAEQQPNSSFIFLSYTHAMKDLITNGLPVSLKRRVRIETLKAFVKGQKKSRRIYDYVFLDEVQDAEIGDLQAVALSAGSRLFVAGDPNQSIYTQAADPESFQRILNNPEPKSLSIVYRLTESLKRIAQFVLPTAHLENARLPANSGKIGSKAVYKHYDSVDEEIKGVWSAATDFGVAQAGNPAAILLPCHEAIIEFISGVLGRRVYIDFNSYLGRKTGYEKINSELRAEGFPLRYLGNGIGTLDESEGQKIIYIMTYHSSKGLDFNNVFLPFLDSGYANAKYQDESYFNTLLFVALTRSRLQLNLSSHTGRPISQVTMMLDNNLLIVDNSKGGSSDPDVDFDF